MHEKVEKRLKLKLARAFNFKQKKTASLKFGGFSTDNNKLIHSVDPIKKKTSLYVAEASTA